MTKATEKIADVRERALEIGVYLPLGAYSKARDQLTSLNKNRLRKQFEDLIDRGQERVKPIEKAVGRRTANLRRNAKSAGGNAKQTVKRTVKRTSASVNPKMPRVSAPETASELPIQSYNSLTANEITSRLQGLTQTDLAVVYKFERGHEARNTILESIESRIVALPLSGYDRLTVDELNSRLEGLSEDDLKRLRRYEADTKRRSTVMERMDSLIA
jgi:hypothetical protein